MKLLLRNSLIALFSLLLIVSPVAPYVGTPVASVEAESSQLGTLVEEEEAKIAPGVTQKKMHVSNNRGNQRVSMLSVDLSKGDLAIETGIPNGKYPGMQTLTGQAKQVSKPGHVVVGGINADFYNMSTGEVVGLFVHNKEWLHMSTRPAFGITEDGKPIIGTPSFSHQVTLGDKFFDIAGTNKARGTDQLVLYTPKQGASTKTNSSGAEVVLENVEGDAHQFGTVKATVKEVISDKGDTPLAEGTIVLSGHGAAKSFLVNEFKEGAEVVITMAANEPWNNVKEAVGGHPLLIESNTLTDLPSNAFNDAVAPRSAVGIKADGTFFFVVIDGRNPGYSEGVTVHELQKIMQEMGAVHALNLDGGGSSTLVARQPSQETVSVVNTPSDGSERLIANSLLIVSSAPVGQLSSLAVTPNKGFILKGSKMQFKASGLDAAYNPVAINDTISWSSSENIADISAEGLLTAKEAGKTKITAATGSVEGSAEVEIVDQIDEIKLPQSELTLDRGGTFDLSAAVYHKGKK